MMSNLLWIAGLIAAIWIIVDIFTKQKSMPTLHKVLWIVAAFFFSILTAIVYFFVVKKGKF